MKCNLEFFSKTKTIIFQIHNLVYKLYDLTPDEIKIIEGEKNEK